MLATLEPVLLLDPQPLLDRFFLSGLAFKSFQLLLRDFPVLLVESRDEPGIWIFDVVKVKMRILGVGLADFCANIVGGLHDFPESWFYNDLRLRFVPLEDDGTRVQCSSQRRNQHHIDFLILNQLPSLLALKDAVLSDLSIQIFPIELGSEIDLTIKVPCAHLMLDFLFCEVVPRFCVSDEINHFKL